MFDQQYSFWMSSCVVFLVVCWEHPYSCKLCQGYFMSPHDTRNMEDAEIQDVMFINQELKKKFEKRFWQK